MTKIFIDGSVGTTGLRINDRLSLRDDIELIKIPEELRKDSQTRKEAIYEADIVFLCLPDSAAIEAVELAKGSNAKIIDTSTAHRINPIWTYGFPELKEQRSKIAESKYVANPGCHASGFIALVYPLIKEGILPKDSLLSCFSITGFSGGGKKMIEEYESKERNILLDAPRQYALTQTHKHLPEMVALCSLTNEPIFCPIVSDFYSGMEVSIPLFRSKINGTAENIKEIYKEYYNSGVISFSENADSDGMLSASAFSGRDDMKLTVQGNDERILLVSRFDNLGKGASGAAIQNMNIMMGTEETKGLSI